MEQPNTYFTWMRNFLLKRRSKKCISTLKKFRCTGYTYRDNSSAKRRGKSYASVRVSWCPVSALQMQMWGAEKKKYFSKTKTKVNKIEITLSKFSNNLINSNCKKSSNLLIIKNCKFFECIVNSTFTWCDYWLSFGARTVPYIRDNICPILSRICTPEICATVAPNLQCSRRTVGDATGAPNFFQCRGLKLCTLFFQYSDWYGCHNYW